MPTQHLTRRSLLGALGVITLPGLAQASCITCGAFQDFGSSAAPKPQVAQRAPQRAQPEPERPTAPEVHTSERVSQHLRLYMTNINAGGAINIALEELSDRSALREVNYFMRDWRTGGIQTIDSRTLRIVAKTHQLLGVSGRIGLISGYRSPRTNTSLRGTATHSLHMVGQANDIRVSGRSPRQIARAARSLNAGGVGTYSDDDFTHVDCGRVRTWGA